MQQGKSESIKTQSGDVRVSTEGSDKIRVEHSGPIEMTKSQARNFADRLNNMAEGESGS